MKKITFFIFSIFLINQHSQAVDLIEKESEWRKGLQFSQSDRIFSEKHDGWSASTIGNIDSLILGGGRHHHFAYPYEGIRYSNFSMRGKACLAIEELLNFYDTQWSSQAISLVSSSNKKTPVLFDKTSEQFLKKLQECIDSREKIILSPQRGLAKEWPIHANKKAYTFFEEIRKDAHPIIQDMFLMCLEREIQEEVTLLQQQAQKSPDTDNRLPKKLQEFEKKFYEDIHALLIVYRVAHAVMKNAVQTFGPESLALRNGNEFYKVIDEGNQKTIQSMGRVGNLFYYGGNHQKSGEDKLKQSFEEAIKRVLNKVCRGPYNTLVPDFFKELGNKHAIEDKLSMIENQLHTLMLKRNLTFKKDLGAETLEDLLTAHSQTFEKLKEIQDVFFDLKEISPLILACRLAAFFDYEASPLFSHDQETIHFFKKKFCEVFKQEIEFFHYLQPEKLAGYQYWEEYLKVLKK